MKYQFNILAFGNSERTYQQGKNKIVDTFDDDMKQVTTKIQK